jgi:type I restriction enzyme S subunit
MSLPRYPKYKDSGVAWLGEVPAHWDAGSLKWLCQRYSGGTPDKNRLEFWENGTIPWLNSGAVNDGRIYEPSAYITHEAFEKSSAKWIPSGALLMALAGQGKTKGMVAQLMFESTCNQSMAAIVPSAKVDARCLYWWLACNYQNIRNMAGGDLRDGLNLDLLGAIPCPLPPLGEQVAIAAFLDRETAKIDALIAEQEKLIALLAEKRQATISHAVTRGLDPNAPMKDSGVPWLGEVPAHWKVGKVGYYISVLPGYAFPSSGFSLNDQHIRLLRGINVGVGEIKWEEVVYWSRAELDGLDAFELQIGDLVIGMDRPLISDGMRVALVGPNDVPSLLLQRVAKVAPNKGMEGRFIMWMLSSREFEAYFTPETTGVSVPHISGDQICGFVIAVPPLDEQQAICDFLELELKKLAILRLDCEATNVLLKERRAALIAAAVTGQIDVRQAA